MLPRQFVGELHAQGDQQTFHVVVEPHDFAVLSEHVLEFGRVRYQVLAGGDVLAEGDAGMRGTISTPGLELRIEQFADAGESGGEAMKTDTFEGTLSADLRTADAKWTNGLGQRMTLKVKASER